MLGLSPQRIVSVLFPLSHWRIVSGDSSNAGLLSPAGSPRPRHRRPLNFSRWRGSRVVWLATFLVCVILFTFWHRTAGLSGGMVGEVSSEPLPKDDGKPIRIGQSVDRDGREVFWWEEFPRLQGFYRGRKRIVSLAHYQPEQDNPSPFEPDTETDPTFHLRPARLLKNVRKCSLYEEEHKKDEDEVRKESIPVPVWGAYDGQPQGMSAPLFGSHKELGFDLGACYDRVSRLGIYGFDHMKAEGDNQDDHPYPEVNWGRVNWTSAQRACYKRNKTIYTSRTAVVIRTWHSYTYTDYDIAILRAMITELALQSGGAYTIHFLVHVQDDALPIWASQAEYDRVLKESVPEEFRGLATLWSVAQMRLIYPGPFPETEINFSGGDLYQAYRSLHFPMQYFASKHPEFDYFWHWEMDIRVTGHYYELFDQITKWAESQPREYMWERNARFYIPSLYNNSYEQFSATVQKESYEHGKFAVLGPQSNRTERLTLPIQEPNRDPEQIVDLITLNPIFNPNGTRWAFKDDITGYVDGRPPTRASLITASRMSRRLLMLMHEETYRKKHTMFPEMYPASVAFHYGLKAFYAPHPVYFDRVWPAVHANEIFNNVRVSEASKAQGLKDDQGFFHGPGGSVFGPGEHVFRSGSYYSNAAFASYLWRRWLGHENRNDEIAFETEDGGGGGRMCLPMMILHTIKED